MRPFGETAALGPIPNVYVIAPTPLKRLTLDTSSVRISTVVMRPRSGLARYSRCSSGESVSAVAQTVL
jgi:predicted glycosyltransferase